MHDVLEAELLELGYTKSAALAGKERPNEPQPTSGSMDVPLTQLRQAKSHSDAKRYGLKHKLLQRMMRQAPGDWIVDQPGVHHPGVTHVPTGFRLHTNRRTIPSAVKVAATPDYVRAFNMTPLPLNDSGTWRQKLQNYVTNYRQKFRNIQTSRQYAADRLNVNNPQANALKLQRMIEPPQLANPIDNAINKFAADDATTNAPGLPAMIASGIATKYLGENGLARVLGVGQYLHGTSPSAAKSILSEGLQTSHGGSVAGSGAAIRDKSFQRHSAGKVHLASRGPLGSLVSGAHADLVSAPKGTGASDAYVSGSLRGLAGYLSGLPLGRGRVLEAHLPFSEVSKLQIDRDLNPAKLLHVSAAEASTPAGRAVKLLKSFATDPFSALAQTQDTDIPASRLNPRYMPRVLSILRAAASSPTDTLKYLRARPARALTGAAMLGSASVTGSTLFEGLKDKLQKSAADEHYGTEGAATGAAVGASPPLIRLLQYLGYELPSYHRTIRDAPELAKKLPDGSWSKSTSHLNDILRPGDTGIAGWYDDFKYDKDIPTDYILGAGAGYSGGSPGIHGISIGPEATRGANKGKPTLLHGGMYTPMPVYGETQAELEGWKKRWAMFSKDFKNPKTRWAAFNRAINRNSKINKEVNGLKAYARRFLNYASGKERLLNQSALETPGTHVQKYTKYDRPWLFMRPKAEFTPAQASAMRRQVLRDAPVPYDFTGAAGSALKSIFVPRTDWFTPSATHVGTLPKCESGHCGSIPARMLQATGLAPRAASTNQLPGEMLLNTNLKPLGVFRKDKMLQSLRGAAIGRTAFGLGASALTGLAAAVPGWVAGRLTSKAPPTT